MATQAKLWVGTTCMVYDSEASAKALSFENNFLNTDADHGPFVDDAYI